MSDQPSQPPKPKPGSLRDRIAAFEKTATAAPPAPAPAPRPKPAGFASWKPKVPSPPSSPSASAAAATEHASSSASRAGGMSASDAKESITKAGSLKDRMAALQGKGAFGAPAPPTAPKPAIEKPKWKPPPVVHAPADDDDHAGEHSTANIAAAVERTLSPPVSVKSRESVDDVPPADESAAPAPVQEGVQEGEPAAVDPEEEERQRRAAIAARMARLGGARVGMAPPAIGKKPPVRRPTQEGEAPAAKKEEVKTVEEPTVGDGSSSEATKPAEKQASPDDRDIVASPPSDAPPQDQAETEINKTPEIVPTRKSSEAASILSSEATDSQASRSPSSMPVPSVPRRSGPPRKKPAKAPTLPPPDVPEEKEQAQEPVHIPAEATNTEKVSDVPVEPDSTEKVEEAPAEKDSNITSLDEPTSKAEQPALIEEAVKILEHKDPKILNESESEDIAKTDDDVPESASSVYLDSPLAPSILTEEVNGIRSPPPSSLSSAALDSIVDDEVEAADIITESPPVPILHSAPYALHENETTATLAPHTEEASTVPAESEEGDEEDAAEEEARRKRVADRIAKMGGVNPLAPRPPAPLSPPADDARSPPFAPSTTPVAEGEHRVDPSSLSLRGTPPAPKGSVVESKAEEESSDENESESEVIDFAASREQDEKPNTPALPRFEPYPGPGSIASQPPPPPIPSTRAPVKVQQYVEQEKEDDEDEESDYGDDESAGEEEPVAAPAQLGTLSGHPTTFTSSPSQHLSEAPSPPNRPAQPPRRIIPQAPEHSEEEEDDEEIDEEADERLATSQLFVPPPSGRGPIAIQPRGGRPQDEEEDGNGSENDTPALPVPHRVSSEVLPPKSISRDEDSEAESDHDGQALPIPPRRTAVPRMAQPPATLPQSQEILQHPPHNQRDPHAVPSARSSSRPGQITSSLSISGSEEILDEEEGDPIDPAFHSPSRQTSFVNLRSISQAQEEIGAQASSPPPATQPSPTHSPVAPATSAPSASAQREEELEQDAEQQRRKTIAERMAKLGGIRFGAAPISTPASRPPPRQEEQQETESAGAEEQSVAALSEEEEERARKERIAAKLATMGGMRIGMMPMGVGGLPPQRSHVLREENVDRAPPAPAAVQTARAVPPSRPPPPAASAQASQDTDSDYGSAAASEDGVKVEAEESEVEELGYEHVEEAPPPVPSRATRAPLNRQSSTGPSSAPPRPPVPTAIPVRRSSTMQSTKSTRSASGADVASSPQQQRTPHITPSEYVMVEEPEIQEAPPPPARPSTRPPPARSAPQVPQPPIMAQPLDMGDSISSQWELPSIPNSSLDFGGPGTDLSMSWTDTAEPTSSNQPQPSSPPPPPPPQTKAMPPSASERQLSADDLMALWGRVGVQVCEVATSLYEKSRKTLIGNGSYAGFVREVLAAVPNAAPVPSASGEYGYTIYVQNGPAVVKRVSEIMPGDLVEIHDAKLKGHKGIQTYHQSVGGAGETLIGVVGEFEAKKSKVRVFHANQHVGQQTVESVSYRLEDLKSGIVKVYRVLDA